MKLELTAALIGAFLIGVVAGYGWHRQATLRAIAIYGCGNVAVMR